MNISGIKKYVKQHPRLECLYMTMQAMGDTDLAKKMVGVKRNPANLIVNHYGEENPDKTLYYILFDKDSRFNGFCSLYRMVLMHLAYAEAMMLTPVVCFGENTLYYDDSIETANAFEYYFKPVSGVDYQSVFSSRRVVLSKGADAGLFGTTSGYVIPEEEISFFAGYINKYLFLKDEVKDQFWDELLDIVYGNRTLGVHVRETDFNKGYNRHPIVVTPKEYLQKAREIFDGYGYEKLFLATDDASVIGLFKQAFGEKLYYYKETFRSQDGKAIHYGNEGSLREHHKYKLGLEIVKDFYTLGHCAGLIAGNSNVSMCSRMLKASTGEKYSTLCIIDKGINKNMRETRSRFHSMLKEKGNRETGM